MGACPFPLLDRESLSTHHIHSRVSPPEPPKKKLRSRWDDDEEEVAREKELKQAKKLALAAKLARERQELELHATRTGSRDGTPTARIPGGDQLEASGRRSTSRGIPKRGREAHPLIESCRSVYSYEVSLVSTFHTSYSLSSLTLACPARSD